MNIAALKKYRAISAACLNKLLFARVVYKFSLSTNLVLLGSIMVHKFALALAHKPKKLRIMRTVT